MCHCNEDKAKEYIDNHPHSQLSLNLVKCYKCSNSWHGYKRCDCDKLNEDEDKNEDDNEDDNNEQMFLGGQYNDAIADRIDVEVCKIINHCEKVARQIILDNRVIIDLAVEKLLDAETIDGETFRKIVSEYTILPVKR